MTVYEHLLVKRVPNGLSVIFCSADRVPVTLLRLPQVFLMENRACPKGTGRQSPASHLHMSSRMIGFFWFLGYDIYLFSIRMHQTALLTNLSRPALYIDCLGHVRWHQYRLIVWTRRVFRSMHGRWRSKVAMYKLETIVFAIRYFWEGLFWRKNLVFSPIPCSSICRHVIRHVECANGAWRESAVLIWPASIRTLRLHPLQRFTCTDVSIVWPADSSGICYGRGNGCCKHLVWQSSLLSTSIGRYNIGSYIY